MREGTSTIPTTATALPAARSSSSSWGRLLLVAVLFLGLSLLGRQSGWFDQVSAESVAESVRAAGPWGAALYIVIFALGEFIHIPGIVFVGAGIFAYGTLLGFGLALVGSIVSVCFSFAVVRTLGGQVARDSRWAFLRRVMANLDRRPIATVVVLRSFLFISPALNYALALSGISFRHYLVGSVLGLSGPLIVIVLLFERIFS